MGLVVQNYILLQLQLYKFFMRVKLNKDFICLTGNCGAPQWRIKPCKPTVWAVLFCWDCLFLFKVKEKNKKDCPGGHEKIQPLFKGGITICMHNGKAFSRETG